MAGKDKAEKGICFHKVFGISLLGGLVSGIGLFWFESLEEGKKQAIKDAMVNQIKSWIRQWAGN